MTSKEKRIIKTLKPGPEIKTPIAKEMMIPNSSGVEGFSALKRIINWFCEKLFVDHIAEKTSGHDIVFDDSISAQHIGCTTFACQQWIICNGDIYTTGSGDDLWLGTPTQANASFQAYANGNLIAKGSITFGSAGQLTIDSSGNLATSGTVTGSNLDDHPHQDVTTTSDPQFRKLFLTDPSSGYDFEIVVTSTIQDEVSELILNTLNAQRTLTISGDAEIADWFNQNVKSTGSPTFVNPQLSNLTLVNSNQNYKIDDRGGYFVCVESRSSGTQYSWEHVTKDHDGTDNVNSIWWAEGNPIGNDVANRSFLQNGFITAAAVADRYFKLHAASGGTGNSYPLKLYTEANVDQIELQVNGDTIHGGTSNHMKVESGGDVVFVGTAGLCYGEISVYNNTTADSVASGSYAQMTRFDTNGPSNNSTPDHTNDHITITKAGHYLVTISASFSGSASVEWTGGAFKNNGATQLTNIQTTRKLGAGGDVGSVSMSGIADLAVNDTIEVWLKQSSGVNKNITVKECTLTIVQIGGT